MREPLIRLANALEKCAAGRTAAEQKSAQREMEAAIDLVELQLHEGMMLLEEIDGLLSSVVAADVRGSADRLADAVARARKVGASPAGAGILPRVEIH
jgi:hypothetical protein